MSRPTFEKQINILDYAMSSIWRRKLKNISVMLVFCAVIFLLASFQMVTRALIRAAAESLVHAPEITIQRISAGRQESIPIAYQERLSSIFGIRKIVPRIWGYYFDEARLANYTILGLDPASMPFGGMLNLGLARGHFFKPEEKGTVVIGQSILKIMDLQGRDFISLFRPDLSLKSFKIAGLFNDETDILTADLIVMSRQDAGDLFAIDKNMATDLCVYVANPSEISTIAKKIAAKLPDARVVTRPQIQKTYQAVFGWRSGFASICLLAAVAAFAILAWDKASGLSPEEKKEVGILKILGWETSDILAMRFWESFLVSGLAFILGCTLAFIHVAFFEASLFRPVMVGWSVLYPPFRLLPDITLADLVLIFCFSVLPYLAATIIPAWRCAVVPPDSVIR